MSAQRVAHGALDVDRGVAERRWVDRVQRGAPELVARTVHDQSLEVDLRRLPVLLGLGQRLAPRRRLRLGLDDVDGGQGADLDPRAVVADELFRQLQRLTLDRHRLHGVDQLPVGVADARQRIGDGLAQVDVGDGPVDARDGELLPRRVDAEPPQQRLRVVRGHAAPVARIEAREEIRGLPPVVVPGDIELPAAPRHRLPQRRVEERRVGQDVAAAIELRGRRRGTRRRAEAARQRRAIERELLGQVQIQQLRDDALDRDIEVAIEGACDRVVDGEVEPPAVRGGLPEAERRLFDELPDPIVRRLGVERCHAFAARSAKQQRSHEKPGHGHLSHRHPPPL